MCIGEEARMSVVAAPLRIQMRGASGAGGGEWGGRGGKKKRGREILRHEIERAEFQPTPFTVMRRTLTMSWMH